MIILLEKNIIILKTEELDILIQTQKIFPSLLIDIKKKLMQFFTLENLLEYIKVLITWMNVSIQIV